MMLSNTRSFAMTLPDVRRPTLPKTNIVFQVKRTCAALREAQNIDVTIPAMKRLLFSPSFLDSFKRISGHHGLNFPLNFPSLLSEINFLSILSLLNFASGYREPLHQQTGCGAWNSIRRLMLGLYISSTGQENLLSAAGMRTISEQQVADLLAVNIFVEEWHSEIPGLIVGKPGGPLLGLMKLITATLRETGEILEVMGDPDLGTFILRGLKEVNATKYTDDPNAGVDAILSKLVGTFPAFQDMAVVDDQIVYCFKKALFLIHAIVVRFRSTPTEPPFPLPNTSEIPVFTDNVIPSMLVHLGIINLSRSTTHGLHTIFPDAADETRINQLLALPQTLQQDTNTAIDTHQVLPREGPAVNEEQSYILRAAGLDACEQIIKTAHSLDDNLPHDKKWIKDITAPELDFWIWTVAKERPDYRKLERFMQRDTIFF